MMEENIAPGIGLCILSRTVSAILVCVIYYVSSSVLVSVPAHGEYSYTEYFGLFRVKCGNGKR